jgi:N-acetylneuraminate synthase
VANKDLARGTILNKNNIWVRRPGNGDFTAEEYYSLIGKKIKSKVKKIR